MYVSKDLAAVPAVLASAQLAVQTELDRIDADLLAAAEDLTSCGVAGVEADAVLQGLLLTHPEIADFFTCDVTGAIVTIEPGACQAFLGTDPGKQGLDCFQDTTRAVMSSPVLAEEHFTGVAVTQPVVADDGMVIGSVAAFFNAQKTLAGLVDELQHAEGLDKLWVMDTAGTIVYDRAATHVGLNLFTADLYKPFPEIIAAAHDMVARPSGAGTYAFVAFGNVSQPMIKDAFWTTVSMHGKEWRVIASFVAPESIGA